MGMGVQRNAVSSPRDEALDSLRLRAPEMGSVGNCAPTLAGRGAPVLVVTMWRLPRFADDREATIRTPLRRPTRAAQAVQRLRLVH